MVKWKTDFTIPARNCQTMAGMAVTSLVLLAGQLRVDSSPRAILQCNVMINETMNIENGVNGTRTDDGGATLGEETLRQQPVPSRNSTAAIG